MAAGGKGRDADGEVLPTLAEIKRRAKEDKDEEQEDSYGRRYRTINFTSEDARVANERELQTYYCSICGLHNLVLEENLKTLPKFENTLVLDTRKFFYKSYMCQSDVIYVKRPEGIETRTIIRCRECDYPISYRVNHGNDMTPFLYIFNDGLVANPTKAQAFFDPTTLSSELPSSSSSHE